MGCEMSARATMLVFFVLTGNLAGPVGALESIAICPGASVTLPRKCTIPDGAKLSWNLMRKGNKKRIIYDLVQASDWQSQKPTTNYTGRVELTADMSLLLKVVGDRDRGVYELDYKHSDSVTSCQSYDLRVTGPPPMPSIDVHPDRIVEGGNVTLSCRVPDASSGSSDNVTVSWFRDGCPLREDAGSERSLALNSDDNGAVGYYGCVVSNACGRSPSAEVRVDVNYEPERMKLRADWTSLDVDSHIIRIRSNSSYSSSSNSSSSNSSVDIVPADEKIAVVARRVYDAVRALLRAASVSSPRSGGDRPRQPGKYPTLAGIFPAEAREEPAFASEASELTRGLLEEKGNDTDGWISAKVHAAFRDALRAFSGDDSRRTFIGTRGASQLAPTGPSASTRDARGPAPPCPATSDSDDAHGALVRLAYPAGPAGGGQLSPYDAVRRALSRSGETPSSLFAFGRRSGDGTFVVVVVVAAGDNDNDNGRVVVAFHSVGPPPGASGCHNATRGGSLSLACITASGPGAVCAWSLDGGRLPLPASPPDACELTIHNLQVGHEGRYECVATNVVTRRRATASTCVYVSDGNRPPPPPEGNGWKPLGIIGVTIGVIIVIVIIIIVIVFIVRAFEMKHKAKRIRETHNDSTRRPGSDADDEANYEDPEGSWPGAEKINQFVSQRDLPGTAPCHDQVAGEPPTSAEAIDDGRTLAVAAGTEPCDYETLQEPLTYAVVNRDSPKPAAAATGTAPCDYETLEEPVTYAVVNRDSPKPAAAATGTAIESPDKRHHHEFSPRRDTATHATYASVRAAHVRVSTGSVEVRPTEGTMQWPNESSL
ncbi:uncharacterized protein LOC144737392 isoform X2 [Lampetra planeri]